MNKTYLLAALCAGVLAFYAAPSAAVTIDYANTANHSINLDPTDNCGGSGTIGCFSFTSPGPSIQITSGSALGAVGGISGTFGVGAIVTSGSTETASVSGAGVLSIFDGSDTLTADLNWVDIASFATAGILNTIGTANLSNINYTGSNSDLLALLNAGSGINTATFQFTTPTSLTTLFTTRSTVTSTSFSGSISPVPVPAAVWLFGSGLLGLVGVARRKRRDA
jgi:hypothetical protein